MNIYEDEDFEIKMNRITDRMGYLVLDILIMSLDKILTESDIFQEFLEARLEARREAPVGKYKEDIPF
ncbi:MAG: hypothetical protein PVJ84_19130 [Desulfobacteraceae bacterium]|jgi:hypothetical protein